MMLYSYLPRPEARRDSATQLVVSKHVRLSALLMARSISETGDAEHPSNLFRSWGDSIWRFSLLHPPTMIRSGIEMKGWLIVISHMNGDMSTYHCALSLDHEASRADRPLKLVPLLVKFPANRDPRLS